MSTERVPIHWDIAGKADGYASAVIGLLLLPLVSLGIQLLFMVLPRLDPGRDNYVSFSQTYWKFCLALQLYLAGIHILICSSALGGSVRMNTAMPLMLGVLLVVIGNYLGKLRPNWMIGIRTPWTLSSKRSWNKTHRFSGWLKTADLSEQFASYRDPDLPIHDELAPSIARFITRH